MNQLGETSTSGSTGEALPTSPPPWKPLVAGVIALLFGPLAGATVTWVNLGRLGHAVKGKRVFAFTLASCIPLVVLLVTVPEGIRDLLGLAVQATGIGVFPFLQRREFAAWQTAARTQRAQSHDKAEEPPTHGGIKSAGWGLLGAVAFLALAGLLGYTLATLTSWVLARADKLSQEGRFPEAERQYRLALIIAPMKAVALARLGVFLGGQDRLDEALTVYAQWARSEPKEAEPHYMMGLLRLMQGNVQAALVECREAERLEPQNPGTHLCFGRLMEEQGDADGAVGRYCQALQQQRDYEAADFALRSLLWERGDPRADAGDPCAPAPPRPLTPRSSPAPTPPWPPPPTPPPPPSPTRRQAPR